MIGCENDDANYDEFQANNDSSSEKIDSEDFDITDKSVDLDSIFLGRLIFIGNQYDFNQNPDIQYDLRYNPRFLEFNHPIFPADEVIDEEIINWAIVYLREQEVESWGIINLDNGNQLQIQVFSSHTMVSDSFTISYRQQKNEYANKARADWWDIAFGRFDLESENITWESLNGILNTSPFE